MKVHWWIIGTIAVLTGSIFALKHLEENKKEALRNIDGNNGKNISEVSSEIPESDSEEIDFLI